MRAERRVVVVVLGGQVVLFGLLAAVLAALAPAFVYAFCAIALLALIALLVFLLRWQRADARRDALLTSGARTTARLVSSRATATRIRNRTVQAHTFEAHAHGRVLRVEARAFTHLPVGTTATIAYDTEGNATVVDDLDRP
ncbi:MAG: hypothetical protein M3422_12865 [Actinomycetota bacterium]|nr:hypothetical protein [Actinomycetota bacterium]